MEKTSKSELSFIFSSKHDSTCSVSVMKICRIPPGQFFSSNALPRGFLDTLCLSKFSTTGYGLLPVPDECLQIRRGNYTQFYRIKGGDGSGRPPLQIIFEREILPQQTIYRWKGNLTASRIHFKYWKIILISRFYEQFSRNGSAMASERLFKKFQTYKI